MFKSITLVGEEFGLQIDRNEDSEVLIVRVNDFILDEKKSRQGSAVFKENNVLEFYPTVEEVKEIIKSLQPFLQENGTNE